jgi:toxin ParE1/3/4
MTARVVVSELADADLAAIIPVIAREAGVATAEKYARRFESLFDRLAAYPECCPIRRNLGPNIRVGVVFPYIVVYRREDADDLVSIIRTLHGRRDAALALLRKS